MKGYVTKIEIVRETGRATLLTRKYAETPAGVRVVENRTPMAEVTLREWLMARGWYYAGNKGGCFTYRPSAKAVKLTVEVDYDPVVDQFANRPSPSLAYVLAQQGGGGTLRDQFEDAKGAMEYGR